jgi:hypothetical protein
MTAVILPALGLLAALGWSVTPVAAADPAPRWGFGWDPGDGYSSGLTLRHRLGRGWEVGLAAGPNDSKSDEDRLYRDSSDLPAPVESHDIYGYRRESGWVRVTGARCLWRDGPFAAAALAGLTYSWSNEQRSDRWPTSSQTADADYYNSRENIRLDLWRFALGLRPSWSATARLTVEFEVGLAFDTRTRTIRENIWYDYDPRIRRIETDNPSHSFSSYGGFEWSRLKFIFWF